LPTSLFFRLQEKKSVGAKREKKRKITSPKEERREESSSFLVRGKIRIATPRGGEKERGGFARPLQNDKRGPAGRGEGNTSLTPMTGSTSMNLGARARCSWEKGLFVRAWRLSLYPRGMGDLSDSRVYFLLGGKG